MKYIGILLIAFSVLFAACGGGAAGSSAAPGKPVVSGKVGDLNASIATAAGVIKSGANEFTLTFSDASGKPVDVGAASVNFYMPAMGQMSAMNDAAALTTTGTAGVYKGSVKLQMAGDWQAQIAFEGPSGKGKGVLAVVAQ